VCTLSPVKTTTWLTLVLATFAALALPAAATPRSDAAPSSIVDMWSRTVTAADAKRRGSVALGLWRFEVKGSGAMSLFNSSSKRAVVTGKLTAATSGTLKMTDLRVTGGGRCTEQATYAWRLTGDKLTLSTGARDKCPGRAAVLVGTWRRA
jgi:hypothetical protein